MEKLVILLVLLSGCTTIQLDSGPFHAKRTAVFYDTDADVTLKTPDGTVLSAYGLKSTVNTKAVADIVGAAVGAAK